MKHPRWPRPVGLLLGYGMDRLLGDPHRFHPVAGFGRLSQSVEAALYRDRRTTGAVHTATLVGGVVLSGATADRALRRRPLVRTLSTAIVTWIVLGGRSLEREAIKVYGHLEREEFAEARTRVTHLVGRDPSGLDADEIARASIESVAENTSDAVVAPLCAGATGGIGGLLGYRAINTLDAMIGHRNVRYRRYGWAGARLDDIANVVPARLTAVLTAMLAPSVRGKPSDSLRAWRFDTAQHPSPNAGPVEAAFAGALGIRLGGSNTYGDVVEERGELGDGRTARCYDIPRATSLARRVDGAALCLAAVAPYVASWLIRRRRRSNAPTWPHRRRTSRLHRRPDGVDDVRR